MKELKNRLCEGRWSKYFLSKNRDTMARWSLCWKWAVLFNIIYLFILKKLFGVPGIKRPQLHVQHLFPFTVLKCQGRVNINQTLCKWEANIYFKNLFAGLVLKISAPLDVWEWLIFMVTTQWCSLYSFLPKTHVPRKRLFNKKTPALAEPAIGRTAIK